MKTLGTGMRVLMSYWWFLLIDFILLSLVIALAIPFFYR